MANNEKAVTQLQDWIRANHPGDDMLWKSSFERQVCFFRDDLSHALGMTYDEARSEKLVVVSTHTNKSIRLPVVRYTLNDATILVRDNFYDYKISVDSDRPLVINPRGLFDPIARHSSVYCEGFPDKLVFGSYAENNRRFTIETADSFATWALAREIRLALSGG